MECDFEELSEWWPALKRQASESQVSDKQSNHTFAPELSGYSQQYGSPSYMQQLCNTPTFQKVVISNMQSPQTPKMYEVDFENPCLEKLLHGNETRCMNFETFKRLDFDDINNEKPKNSVEFSSNGSDTTLSFSVLNSLRSTEDVLVFPDYSQLPSIDELPLDRE